MKAPPKMDCCKLVRLVQQRNYTGVKNAVAAGAKVNCVCAKKGGWRHTPLLVATQKNDLKMVSLLLDLGAKPDFDVGRYTGSLHITKSAAIAKKLIAAGANINGRSSDGYAPIHVAMRRLEVLKVLVEAGADLEIRARHGNETALEMAIFQCMIKPALYLIERGADADAPGDCDVTTFLSVAGHPNKTKHAVMKALLKDRRRLTQRDVHGRDAMLWACAYSDLAMVRMLLAAGADVNSSDRRGNSALSYAIDRAEPELIRHLLEHGADLEARVGGKRPEAGKTCRELAAMSRYAKVRDLVARLDKKKVRAAGKRRP